MIVVYLPEGFADWEGGLLLGELAEARVSCVIAAAGSSVRSMGGMKVVPESQLVQIPASSISCLVLVGSDSWRDPLANALALSVARSVLEGGGTVAAICAAVSALSRAGISGGRLITQPGHRFVQFTFEVLRVLGVYSPAKLEMWLAQFQDGVVPPESYWSMK